MKSYFIHAHVELVDGTRVSVGQSYDVPDDYFECAGIGIINSSASLLQDLFNVTISFVESFCISLDDSDDDL